MKIYVVYYWNDSEWSTEFNTAKTTMTKAIKVLREIRKKQTYPQALYRDDQKRISVRTDYGDSFWIEPLEID